MQYVLIGNYGVGNLGDEALREYFLTQFPDVHWNVLSAHSRGDELPRLPAGIRSFFTPWWKTLHAIRRSDGVVFGGGSLFTDTESSYACFLWWWHVLVACLLQKKIALAFQGIGPFRTRRGEWFARSACRMASHVSVRDSLSRERLEHWKLNTEVIQTFDPVFSLIDNEKKYLSSKNVFVIVPRKNSSATFQNRARELLDSRAWDEVRILSMQPDDPEECVLCAQLTTHAANVRVVPVRLLPELAMHIAAGTTILTQRYHAALAALALGKAFEALAQEEGDKLSELTKYQGHSQQCLRLVRDGEAALRGWLERRSSSC
ncbi:MAG: polysaccharide pyruvyl transferase family protein [Candidatus Peribacteraceae bacterium]|nr:polysaccharide pyruvyl transferase family protein [Candidatus Peribacteraceae bacterium]